MKTLSLRLRIFLFFCLIGFGGLIIILGALWLGFRQLGDPDALSSFMSAGIIASFALLALVIFVWRLFDENVSKPIEGMASQLRVGAAGNADAKIDAEMAKYLGDLAPAASVLQEKFGQASADHAETVSQKTARLERQLAQLLRILSDIPIAVIVATRDHKIVLYDGQAADLMDREAPARLNCSVFDYLDEDAIRAVLTEMESDAAARRQISISGKSGAVYSGHIRLFGIGAGYTLMLEPLDHDAARPLVYDFDLLDKERPTDPNDTSLRDLTLVVFDSETTGLDPLRDEVVQLGAVRIVNGRIVPGEEFDSLVNPGRPIPAISTKVHHITNEMVTDAPPFTEVCKAFHRFTSDSVIVAHNAPFDMAFLHRQAGVSGVQFDNPILDTVHLSAVVFGGSAEHTLDAICDRLGVEIPADQRHTALGDAIATAKVLVAMLPILEARGLQTFGQIRAEVRKHSRILKVQE